jgi:hypothetical protein
MLGSAQVSLLAPQGEGHSRINHAQIAFSSRLQFRDFAGAAVYELPSRARICRR